MCLTCTTWYQAAPRKCIIPQNGAESRTSFYLQLVSFDLRSMRKRYVLVWNDVTTARGIIRNIDENQTQQVLHETLTQVMFPKILQPPHLHEDCPRALQQVGGKLGQ